MKKQIYIIFAFLIKISFTNAQKADLIVYSFDRPLQLYALLESVEKYITNLDKVNIIYRVSNEDYQIAYQIVKEKFSNFKFIKQGQNPHQDFKPIVFNCLYKSNCDYILFAVDDIIVKDCIDIAICLDALNASNAYGFYLRLGKNITFCYMENKDTPVPSNKLINNNIYIYKFSDGKGDWAYPNCNDMTIYRKKDILNDFKRLDHFRNTSYEGYWHNIADLNKYGLFFEESKIVNIPLNLTNEESRENRNMNLYSAKDLLQKFNDGYKINIEQFCKYKNKSPHEEIVPEFINR